MPDDAERVSLRPITTSSRPALEALRVRPDQENLVDGVSSSLAEAAAKPDARPWCRGIYAGDVPVGFLMLADGVQAGHAEIPWPYYLWRFLIDARFQGQGYGRAALARLVAYVSAKPDADMLITTVVPGDGSPLGFYVSCGFRDTGTMFDRERVLELNLARPH